jgi:hypothetical protein
MEPMRYIGECIAWLFAGIWMLFGIYGFLVAIDLDGSRARLKEYDRLAQQFNPLGVDGIKTVREALKALKTA